MNSGNKTFDKQADYIGTGNVFSNVQIGAFIRPKNQTECNGKTFAAGELQEYDLKPFRKIGMILIFETLVKEAAKTKQVCLSAIFHRRKNKRILHGFILTKDHTEYHELIDVFPANYRAKTISVLNAVKEKLTNRR